MKGRYCTVQEASETIGVHPKTIRRYIYDGKLSARKIGREWQVDIVSIEELLKNSTNSCCSSSSSEDDYCVFMDNDGFQSDDEIQICSIIDIYIENKNILTEILNGINLKVNNYDETKKFKYNYVYDNALKKTRLVFWGSADFMSQIIDFLKKYS